MWWQNSAGLRAHNLGHPLPHSVERAAVCQHSNGEQTSQHRGKKGWRGGGKNKLRRDKCTVWGVCMCVCARALQMGALRGRLIKDSWSGCFSCVTSQLSVLRGCISGNGSVYAAAGPRDVTERLSRNRQGNKQNKLRRKKKKKKPRLQRALL